MKILVTGKQGGLVRDRLVNFYGVIPLVSDITDEERLKEELYSIKPDVVVHAAAMTGVDACERDLKEAFRVNVRGTTYVAEACHHINSQMVYLSTCHIFDGKSKVPYPSTFRAEPLNVYGMTKWQGEVSANTFHKNVLIVRISKLFSSNLYRQYLESYDRIVRPTFIVRNYTHVNHFCDLLIQLLHSDLSLHGVINVGSYDYCSDYSFWEMMFSKLGINSRLIVPNLYDNPEFTPRPHNGSLNMDWMEDNFKLPSVEDGIDLVVEELLG